MFSSYVNLLLCFLSSFGSICLLSCRLGLPLFPHIISSNNVTHIPKYLPNCLAISSMFNPNFSRKATKSSHVSQWFFDIFDSERITCKISANNLMLFSPIIWKKNVYAWLGSIFFFSFTCWRFIMFLILYLMCIHVSEYSLAVLVFVIWFNFSCFISFSRHFFLWKYF